MSGRLEKLSTDCHGDGSEEEVNRVKQVPFTFSLIELLPMCQQVEMLLPTYCTSISGELIFIVDLSAIVNFNNGGGVDLQMTQF